jgi:hypothetical protein
MLGNAELSSMPNPVARDAKAYPPVPSTEHHAVEVELHIFLTSALD